MRGPYVRGGTRCPPSVIGITGREVKRAASMKGRGEIGVQRAPTQLLPGLVQGSRGYCKAERGALSRLGLDRKVRAEQPGGVGGDVKPEPDAFLAVGLAARKCVEQL